MRPVIDPKASRILLAAHINHDRIWRLEAPLVAGQRQSWREREVRLGGGGWFTGMRLCALGWQVDLLSHLARDARGEASYQTLAETGFTLDLLDRSAAETRLTEILLSPDGERTILAPPGAAPVFDLDQTEPRPAAAYLNIRHAGPGLIACLDQIPWVMIQLPIAPESRMPADLAVTSRADFPALTLAGIWDHAHACAGARLKTLIVTDGAGPVEILSEGARGAPVAVPDPLPLSNSIGAGDSFAGYLLDALLRGADPRAAVMAANLAMRDWLIAGTAP
ncbi:PfkB family carbohydrate kinase [Paracoccus aminophilus]|uniref:Carbohydrate kinase n=1 Tax=Paracoccus aminophilus JCM 7686 TaxID=1367847 RepID=S5XMS8_PARAH|nr:PfkB family carbohydrate kinase [Paracoccus aminophilus]AGT08564.1 carbohydrate kinase [Paracoccus aminophilus JCM 7686]